MALVGHYQLEENSGSRVDTVNAYDLDEITNDSVAAVPGVIGNALNANAAFGHVGRSVGLPAWDASATGFTFSCWIKFNTLPLVDEQVLVLGRFQQIAQILRRSVTGRFAVEMRDSAGNFYPIVTAKFEESGIWHLVTATYAPDSTFDLYIDGVFSNGVPTVAGETLTIASGPLVRIGANNVGANSMDGAIDDLRFYDHKLSVAEVNALFVMAPAANSPRRRSSNGWHRSSS